MPQHPEQRGKVPAVQPTANSACRHDSTRANSRSEIVFGVSLQNNGYHEDPHEANKILPSMFRTSITPSGVQSKSASGAHITRTPLADRHTATSISSCCLILRNRHVTRLPSKMNFRNLAVVHHKRRILRFPGFIFPLHRRLRHHFPVHRKLHL